MENILINGELLYNIAAGLGFVAYLMTNVLWLRVILIIGAAVYIYTGFVLDIDSMIGWHIAYGIINFIQVILILMLRSNTVLPDPIRTIYTDQFHSLRPKEFKRLMQINAEGKRAPGIFLSDGDENNRIYLITDGEVIIEKDGKQIATCKRGDFIGEMSVLTGHPVSTNVIIKKPVKYVYWHLEDLEKIEKQNLSLYNRFMMVVGRNLVKKLRLSAQAFATA